MFCAVEPKQPRDDRLRGQQSAAVLPERRGQSQRKGQHDGIRSDQRSGLEGPLYLLCQVRQNET